MSRVKSHEKRTAILAVAKALFLSKGYAAVSMDLISKTSGVSKNTLYAHFNNKKTLFSSVIEAHWGDDNKPSLEGESSLNVSHVLTEFSVKLMRYLYKKETLSFFRLLANESHSDVSLAGSILSDNLSPSTYQLTQYFMRVLDKRESEAHRLALFFLGLLKEDAFWHVLVGFRKKYTRLEMKRHIERVVAAFMLLL